MLPIVLLSKKNLTSRLAIRHVSGIPQVARVLVGPRYGGVAATGLYGLTSKCFKKTLRAGLSALLRVTAADYPFILNAN